MITLPPSEITEDMNPHDTFLRGSGIRTEPTNSLSPTSPQLPVCSLGGGAGAHTPASLSPTSVRALVEVCKCGTVKEVHDGVVGWRVLEEWERISLENEPGIALSHTVCPLCAAEFRRQLMAMPK